MVQPLRIAIVRQRYNPFGGAERFVERAMRSLRERGAEVTLITRRWQGESAGNAIVLDPFYVGSTWRDWGFAHAVCTTLGKRSFDLVQSHERIDCCDVFRAGDGVHAEWLAQRDRVCTSWARAATRINPYHRYTLDAERRLFSSPRLRAVICNSSMVRQEIREHFAVPDDKLHVVYNGVDTGDFHPGLRQQHRTRLRAELGLSEDAMVFLFLGSGFVRKGLATALDALRATPANCCLVVVGTDKHRRAFERRARALGLEQRVRFVGGQRVVHPYYGCADAFVLPTLYDPFPNAVLEALACALPVVTSRKCGAAEVVSAHGCGFVHDALDSAGFGASMTELCDPQRLRGMSDTARGAAMALTLEAMTERLLALYGQLLGARAG